MLNQAGIDHEAEPAAIDESTAKQAGRPGAEVALELAREKALAVSRRRPGDWVIGSDSVVSIGGTLFDKPADRDQAAEHLRRFSGRTMELSSAVALARDGAVDWTHADSATLKVRDLSEAFIEVYLEAEWPAVAGCVGVFRMEARGVQLFARVDGSHFTILGMPLVPLLAALRDRGLAAS